jgi:hypothetical protein
MPSLNIEDNIRVAEGIDAKSINGNYLVITPTGFIFLLAIPILLNTEERQVRGMFFQLFLPNIKYT